MTSARDPKKPLILNIDDDEPGRYAVSRTLRQAGFEVLETATGKSALDLAVSDRPDLILLDIRLPDIDGFEVCRRIRENPEIATIPIVQMSASYLDSQSMVKGLNSGADAYLTEPTEPPVLIATVKSMLRMKRAEQDALRSAQRWIGTFEAIADGIAILDADGSVVQSNSAFSRIHGSAEAIAQAFASLRLQPASTVSEIRVGDRFLTVALNPTFGEDGEWNGAVCIICDITAKKKLEDQLRQTARLESIGVLAGGIAHDFNNLLTGILGNASLLLERPSRNPQDRELVQEILKASESAADLTRQILAYSGKGSFFMKQLDAGVIASEVRAFVRRLIPPRVELSMRQSPDLPLIEGDTGQLHQLMMNLIVNAAEAFPDGAAGRVSVAMGSEYLDENFFHAGEPVAAGQYVSFTVSDNGSGMGEETQRRIFEPFFTTKFTGRGLGLSAALGIVQAHRGLLRMESAPGKGTTFRIYFPVTARRPSAPQAPAEVPELPLTAVGTILVVDDEPQVRNFAKLVLENVGYQVLLAENGQESVDIFEERHADLTLVLLDLTMPVMSGEEALPRYLEINRAIPVVLSSGFNQSGVQDRFQGLGLAGFLSKPYTARKLVEVVRSVLAV